MFPAQEQEEPAKIVNLFYCYAPEDTKFQRQLRAHLSHLRRQKLLDDWGPGDIRPGQSTPQEIDNRINAAQIILLLVSSDFTCSDYCAAITHRALERHHLKEASVLPILLRSVKALLLQAQEPRFLRKSLLLAVEALRLHHSVEADQAVRYAVAMLPCFLSRVNMTTGQMLLFSGDGCSLASAGGAGVSWIYHVKSDEELTKTLHLGDTRAIALSYHGEYLLAGTYAGAAWLIDTINICRVAMIKYAAHIRCVALTRKEPYYALIGYDDGTIKICQFLEENASIPPLSHAPLEQRMSVLSTCSHGSAISSLSLSQNERYLLSGGADNIIRVWSKSDGSCLDTHNFKSPIRCALFSPDDTTVAVVTENGTAFVWQWEQKVRKMWQTKKGQIVRLPQKEKIQALTFSPDGTCLATASVDGFARIWNLQEMIEATSFPHKSPVSALCYLRDIREYPQTIYSS
jgi:WD40 repeat protein